LYININNIFMYTWGVLIVSTTVLYTQSSGNVKKSMKYIKQVA